MKETIKVTTPWGDINALKEDHITNMIRQNGGYEVDLINRVLMNCSSDRRDTFIDVGACYGTHSLAFSQFFNNGHAFEPNIPQICDVNTPEAVEVWGYALAHTTFKGGMTTDENNVGHSSISSSGADITVKPLDSFSIKGSVDLIKIDVEGMERAVIEGAKKTIEEHRPVIACEHRGFEKNEEKKGIYILSGLSVTEFLMIDLKYTSVKRIGSGNLLFIP